ncbi:NAD-dependent epimerase/dehydratase family protein [Siccirubricoccus phaeus]|uniref:NAD-dependent epimerase/dehydratase family protein n=1 Tax=Siccirubricoccus phaeus TaxID=2595053 RepID=UPI00165A3DD1|nr:NAD(P)-dependent oxidoreductase [Siccirubricoccus phaeus]
MGAVLLTGIGGLIGHAVARQLVAAGREVVALDRVPVPDAPCQVHRHEIGEVHRLHELVRQHRVTRIIHAGSISGPMVAPEEPAKVLAVNLGGLVDMLEVARIHGLARVVWFSSILAYEQRGGEAPVAEDAPLGADEAYGASKVAGEAVLRAYAVAHGVSGVAFRVASCYGPGRTTSCFIRTLVENARAGRPTLVPDATARDRQHIYVDDVAVAVVTALDAPNLPQRTYNLGPGEALTAAEVAARVGAGVPGVRLEVDLTAPYANRFALGPLDITAALRDLGFAPRIGLAEGAARTAAWLAARDRRTP